MSYGFGQNMAVLPFSAQQSRASAGVAQWAANVRTALLGPSVCSLASSLCSVSQRLNVQDDSFAVYLEASLG